MKKLIAVAAVAASAMAAALPMSALATDLEDFYFRYDFSDGTRQFIGSASQASDPLTTDAGAANFVAAYGQDGAATAVHVKSNAYGTDKIGGAAATGRTVLAGNWTLAMSVRPGSVEKGLLFSLGRANDNNSKCVFLASSSTAGKIYVGTARKKGSANSYTGSDRELAQEWGLTGASADTTSGYHSIVAVHSSGGTVAVYVDGELAGSVDTTENASGCVFGNGIQFNQAHGSSTFLSANGYSQSLNNPDVAFQDVRFYNFAFTAETAAAYAALYPATLPGFSNLDQYAYVQSYGVNGVDTGYKATDNTKFVVDFEFTDVSYKSWLMGASESGLSQTHAIYLNTNKQLAWTTRGQHWVAKWPSSNITGTSIENVRLVENILSAGTARSDVTASVTWYNARTTMNSKLSNSGNSNSLTTKGQSTVTTHLFRGNGIMDDNTQACKAKIYSFEVDDDCTSGVPAAFFAPTTDGNGAAGFTNVVAGTFHGECLSSPSTALLFTPGIGQAEDYRYRSGKFYSRIYARSADASQGLVKFDGGEAAGTNAQFTARGKTATITAVPAEGWTLDRWVGDTWAITAGSETTADITVKSDTAIQLRATFVANHWTNVDGTGSLDSAANWTVMPESGGNVILELSEDTMFVSSAAKTFGQVAFTGAYSADFSGTETVTLSSIELNNLTNLVTGGKLKFTSIAIPQTCTVTITGAEGLADGGLTGKGTLVIDPGAGNTYTMSKSNTGFTGEAVIKSGTVKFGDSKSFGPIGRASVIRVKGGAVLNEANVQDYTQTEKQTAVLEAGAKLVSKPGMSDSKLPPLTTLTLEGNATVDTSDGMVSISSHYNESQTHIKLGTNTLTKVGGNNFYISYCMIEGTGTLDIKEGNVVSTHDYGGDSTTTCANGTIRIREGATWNLSTYHNHVSKLSVKNLVLDGSVTRGASSYTLTVTGYITGNGTTPMLTMGSGAVFKPSGTGYLNITQSLSGKMKVNIDDLAGKSNIPLLKVPTTLADTARTSLDISGLGKWVLKEKTVDGYVCFDIAKNGLIFVLR